MRPCSQNVGDSHGLVGRRNLKKTMQKFDSKRRRPQRRIAEDNKLKQFKQVGLGVGTRLNRCHV